MWQRRPTVYPIRCVRIGGFFSNASQLQLPDPDRSGVELDVHA